MADACSYGFGMSDAYLDVPVTAAGGIALPGFSIGTTPKGN